MPIEFPDKLQCLFRPSRYKILYGGRGAGRSWNVARASLLIGAGQIPGSALAAPLRVLCAREFQNSIAESVHKVIADQIDLMGMNYLYEVQRDKIFGRAKSEAEGTSYSFEGIKNNVNRIKSYEGIKLCWVEEAVKVSQNSWGVLIPTVRAPDSEIWMTFNPELETDYTYRRFVLEKDESMIVEKMTYKDNPWFPEVLQKEMERDRERDPDYYLNVWEGHCLQQLEGAVYAKELRRAQEDNRIGICPYDPEWPCEVALDLGRADATAIWVWQKIALQHRVVGYYSATGEDIGHYIKWLKDQRYSYSRIWLPHDARAKRLGTKHSIEEIFRQHYPEGVYIVPRLSVVDGINAGRMLLQKCWFNEASTGDGISALRHYRFRVVDGALSNEPLHDWASDGADAFRYMAIAAGRARSSDAGVPLERLSRISEVTNALASAGRSAASSFGWMR